MLLKIKKSSLFALAVIFILITTNVCIEAEQEKPPFIPKWVLYPWMWRDEADSRQILNDIRNARLYEIPFGVVVIDSPWETGFNTLEFNPNLFGYPGENPVTSGHQPYYGETFIKQLHQEGLRVVLWITGMINLQSRISNQEQAKLEKELWDEAARKNYFYTDANGNPIVFNWWMGKGSPVDLTDPESLEWWNQKCDRLLRMGIDGWKVDGTDYFIPIDLYSKGRRISNAEYSATLYSVFYRNTQKFGPNKANLTRAIDGKRRYCPLSFAQATWAGDQFPTWNKRGFKLALDNFMDSIRAGYPVVGSDIGGYFFTPPPKDLYYRWVQFGALTPLMETQRMPWEYDRETAAFFKRYAELHCSLIPYMYSYIYQAHLDGTQVMKPVSGDYQYLLGEFLLVAPCYTRGTLRKVEFPEGQWLDYWNPEIVYQGGTSQELNYPIDVIPLFKKKGAIIPKQSIKGRNSFITFYPEDEDGKITIFHLYDEDGLRQVIEMKKIKKSIRIKISNFSGKSQIYIQSTKIYTEFLINGRSIHQDQDGGWIYSEKDKGYLINISSDKRNNIEIIAK